MKEKSIVSVHIAGLNKEIINDLGTEISKLWGGVSVTEQTGYYTSAKGELVVEASHKFEVVLEKEELSFILAVFEAYARKAGQESILVERRDSSYTFKDLCKVYKIGDI